MTVKFLGWKSNKKSGCGVCGRKATTTTFERTKKFMLPSGRMMTCHAGREYEVSDIEGAFLLEMSDVFKAVE